MFICNRNSIKDLLRSLRIMLNHAIGIQEEKNNRHSEETHTKSEN